MSIITFFGFVLCFIFYLLSFNINFETTLTTQYCLYVVVVVGTFTERQDLQKKHLSCYVLCQIVTIHKHVLN